MILKLVTAATGSLVRGVYTMAKNRSKLVHFKEQKIFFEFSKTPSLER
jgi:hypothetical protein